ncbi:MAG: hypothetical protein AAGJ87_15855, partial [Pseudomonadota bacterium]
RRRRIRQAINQVRDAIAAGAMLEEASAPFNAEPSTMTISARTGAPEFNPDLQQRIFLADQGGVAVGPAPTGEAQTIVVVNKIDFDRTAISPAQEQIFRQYAGYQLDQELLDAYLQTLQADYNVRIDTAQIDGLFNGQQ